VVERAARCRRPKRIGRLTGFVAALLLAVTGFGQPLLADIVAADVECCLVAPRNPAGPRIRGGNEQTPSTRATSSSLLAQGVPREE